MSAPPLSVLMSVYNDARWVAQAVDSISGQCFGDFEFLIVDDGSTDGSGAILDACAARDPRIRLWHRPNQGLVASLNFALAQARAPLVARMDADDISRPRRFERQIAFLAENPGIAVLGTNTDEIDEQGRESPCTDLHPLEPDAVAQALLCGSPICHPSVMMRADAVRSAGGYRAAFRHCEDYDLWLRMAEGWRLANLPDRLLLYRRSAGQISRRHSYEQAMGAAMARLAHAERTHGRADPFAGLERLPAIDALDEILGRAGTAAAMRGELAPHVVHSREAMAGPGYALLRRHLAEGGDARRFWRTVPRLARMGMPTRALRLARVVALAMLAIEINA